MSGFCKRRRQSATRRSSPPESTFTEVSPGGQRSASIASSRRESRSQASSASSFSCTSPWRARSLSISSGSIGSANLSEIASNSASSATVSAAPSLTTSSTVLAGSSFGSCSRKPTEYPGEIATSPMNEVSTPAMMRSSVLLPEPLRPMTPILAP